MHSIYDSKGDVGFLFNIPKAIYSTVISAIINAILKFLALTEYDILLIKEQKTLNDTLVFAKGIKKCLYIKISIYYIISFVLIFFYWYFISCFCAVYNNTQIILIKNCFTSFIISLIYPFGLFLIPSFLRISSLNTTKKNRKFLYQISKVIVLLL